MLKVFSAFREINNDKEINKIVTIVEIWPVIIFCFSLLRVSSFGIIVVDKPPAKKIFIKKSGIVNIKNAISVSLLAPPNTDIV